MPSVFPALRRLALALALALGSAACSGGGIGNQPSSPGPITPSGSSVPFITYANGSAGFTIRYPADWEKSESVQGTVVLFKSPSEGPTDPVRESVGVSTEELPASFTLDAYTEAALGQVRQVIPEFHLIASESATLAGRTAHRLVYTGLQGITPLEWLQVYTIVGKTGYILTFASAPDRFSPVEGTAQAIFDSFALTLP